MTRLARVAPVVRLVLVASALALAACGKNPTAPDRSNMTPPTTAKPDYINPHI